MSVNVEFPGHAAHVLIDVVGYETSAAVNLSDANWLTCRVEVRAGAFCGHIDTALTTQDFAAFSRSLRAGVTDCKGDVVFVTDEDAFRLDVHFDTTGRVSITGVLREPGRSKTFLSFSFESDQTFMRRTLATLDEVNSQFPVRNGLVP